APNIFANWNSQAYATEAYGSRHRTGRKYPFFIEHPVVRKVDLVTQRCDRTAVEQRDSVVKPSAIEPRRSNQERRTRRGGFTRKRLDCCAASGLKSRFKH